jgi:hypothetical protein
VNRPRRRRPAIAPIAAVLPVLLAAGLAACGPGPSPSTGPVSPVDGIIVGVDATNISNVRGFTLRTGAGEMIQFALGQLENPTQFPPGHLLEHEATSQPVRVYFATSGSTLLVYRLEDAPGSSAPLTLGSPQPFPLSTRPLPSNGINAPP